MNYQLKDLPIKGKINSAENIKVGDSIDIPIVLGLDKDIMKVQVWDFLIKSKELNCELNWVQKDELTYTVNFVKNCGNTVENERKRKLKTF